MRRFSTTLGLSLSKLIPSPHVNSRINLITKTLHISRVLSNNSVESTEILNRVSPNNNNRYEGNQEDELAADVEKIYRILRNHHSRVPKLELALTESTIDLLRPGLIPRVLNRCGDAGNLGYRFFLWASKQPDYHHSHEVCRSMVKILSKMRQFGSVWALLEEMKNHNPHLIEPELFVVLMRRFASANMPKKAVEVLDEMPKYGIRPDESVFGCLLDALCKNGYVEEASEVLDGMRERFPPNLRCFTSLLYGWCREGKLVEAKEVLVRMKEAGVEPDVVVYTNLLSGYAHAGRMADAYDLMKDMRGKGLEPNANCYTVLIQALCKMEKRMDEAMRVFVEMERYGCEGDVVTYTALVSGFCKWGMVDKGYGVLEDMRRKGVVASQVTYMQIMVAHEKKEEFEECLELVEKMKERGCHPDLLIYNVVIRLACKLGEVKEAVRLWNEMEATSGLSPGADTFVIMINGFTSQGYLVEACDHFKEMVSRGIFSAPQYGTLKMLLNNLVRDDKVEMAKDVWSCISNKSASSCELNVAAWTIWIHALLARGHVKEACSYCLEMMEMDLMPQPDTYVKLMKGLNKLYNRTIAAEITEKVMKMASEREMSFKMYKRKGEEDLIEKAKPKGSKEGKKKGGADRSKNKWGGERSRAKAF
ncbi:putative pentatricopeptide repeat-containing protein [Hirschfeldia incana]|nr:putative pentatricopeptide repeat-containing protein [Hirschfeldia incana]